MPLPDEREPHPPAASRLTVHVLDTGYLDIPDAAAAFLVSGGERPLLVECGCAVAFDALRTQLASHGVAVRDLAAVVVTHIHLDHAGSAGHFAREGVPVFVHPRGARHLVDPARLIAGSRAVHGPRYDRWYGDPLPIDPALVHPIEDGHTQEIAGLRLTAIETPGHAKHHHAWLVGKTVASAEAVFVGDVVGMISPGSNYISIPVPPSDIDVPAWRESIARLRALPPDLDAILTHGGRRPLGEHLDAFITRMNEELPLLGELAEVAKREPLEADARYREFLLAHARRGGLGDELAAALLGRAFRGMNLAGIADAKAAGRFAVRV